MAEIKEVCSTEFASRFRQWSFTAQAAPVIVTNKKTGMVLGYFVSAGDCEEYLALRRRSQIARFAWEMPDDLAADLDKPSPRQRPELDALMMDE